MFSQDFLDMLRLPVESGRRAPCCSSMIAWNASRSALRFAIKDGLPILVVEEAVLPAGCESISQLPCQREEKKSGA